MYQPTHFAQQDPEALAAMRAAHPLATLVTLQDGEPTADHIPLVYDAQAQMLRGHVARANPLWRVAAGQTGPYPTAGARTGSSTRPTGPARPSSRTGSTGSSARRSLPLPHSDG